jgi:hypothetical protein
VLAKIKITQQETKLRLPRGKDGKRWRMGQQHQQTAASALRNKSKGRRTGAEAQPSYSPRRRIGCSLHYRSQQQHSLVRGPWLPVLAPPPPQSPVLGCEGAEEEKPCFFRHPGLLLLGSPRHWRSNYPIVLGLEVGVHPAMRKHGWQLPYHPLQV